MLKKKLTRNQILAKYNKALEENLEMAMKIDGLKKYEEIIDQISFLLAKKDDSALKTEILKTIDDVLEGPKDLSNSAQ